MTVEIINRWIIVLSTVACLCTGSVVYLNYRKNILSAAASSAQRQTITQLRALVATVRSSELELELAAPKAPHTMNAMIAPVAPQHVVALAREDASFVRFVARDGRMIDPTDETREIKLVYEPERGSKLIGASITSLLGYHVLAFDLSDVVAIANLKTDAPVRVRWAFRVNSVEVARGESQFSSPSALAVGEFRVDVRGQFAGAAAAYESTAQSSQNVDTPGGAA